jgi:Na+(H+)/acetate symporter ActP
VLEPAAIGAVVAVAVVTLALGARGVRVSKTPADFLVAARQVPPATNAAAISGEYLSAASFLGIAGLALQSGLGALWYAVGYAAGYLVLLATVAAPLRRFGAYTIPDFAEGRLDSRRLRQTATIMVLVISLFYVLPQLNGAGITLQQVFGAPYWLGVVAAGLVVTVAIASGGMKSITVVQAFQFWLKLTALGVPALVLLALVHHPPLAAVSRPAPAVFAHRTVVRFPVATTITLVHPVTVLATGVVAGVHRSGALHLVGTVRVGARSALTFPAGSAAPGLGSQAGLTGQGWSVPLVRIDGHLDHPLAATYGVIVATFLGALGLPHILVRFYTNPDGQAARRTTTYVVLLLSAFYLLPGLFAVLGRLEAPELVLTGRADDVVLVLPHLAAAGPLARVLGALVAAGAFAAFLSTTSGLVIAMAGALSHDVVHGGTRAFRVAALAVGMGATLGGLAVGGYAINVLVGWAFAIAASSFCPLLILGIWWPRLTWVGALAGLLVGGGASSGAIVATMVGVGTSGWPAVLLGTPAVWTVPLAFGTMLFVSWATPSSLPANVTGKLLALHLPEELRPGRRRPGFPGEPAGERAGHAAAPADR